MRSLCALFALALVVVALARPGWAQVNDDCQNAQPITGGVVAFDTTAATTDGQPVDPSQCTQWAGLDNQVYNDVWFQLAIPNPDLVTLSTCGTASFDTRLVVYGAPFCPANPFDVVACNDDQPGCPGETSEVSFFAEAGVPYLVRVGGFDPAQVGAGQLQVNIGTGCVPPVADFFPDPPVGTAPLAVVFQNFSGGTPPLQYAWDFDGDGAIDSTDQSPAFTFNTPGLYPVTLVVGNPCGSDTLTQVVDVQPLDTVTVTIEGNVDGVPIAISPADENGDGDGTTPTTREYAAGTTVDLDAPNTHNGRTFLRWEVDGEQQPHGQTSLELTTTDPVTVEAVYQTKITDCKELIALMIGILEDCFKDAAAPQTTAGVVLGPGGAEIIACLKKINDQWHMNVKKDSTLPARTNAHVDGDDTKNCTDDDIIVVNGNKFPTSDCGENFGWYLGTLYHETTHSLQDWKGYGTKGAKFRAEIELPANMNDKKVNSAIRDAVAKILENRSNSDPDTDDLDECYKHFTNQKTAELQAMKAKLDSEIANDCRKIEEYETLLGVTVNILGPPTLNLAELLYAASLADDTREDFAVLVTATLRTSTLNLDNLGVDPPLQGTLDTGIDRVLDVRVIRDSLGEERLLVFGTTRGYESGQTDSGVVKVYGDQDNDGFFDAATESTLVAGVDGFQSATNLTVDPTTGLHYIYDAIARQLRPFSDTDADNIPDTLGASVIPDLPGLMVQMSSMEFSLGRLEARMRFSGIAQGDQEVVIFTDPGQDGFFESAVRGRPSILNDRQPTVCTFPFVGNTILGLAGQPQHTLRLDEVTSAGVFLQTLATGVVPPTTNEVFLTFGSPLAAGQFLQIVDLDSGETLGPFPTRAPEPTVYRADVTEGPVTGGTAIVYTAEHLTPLAAVEFGGLPAVIVSQTADLVVVETPPALQEGHVAVEFIPLVGPSFPVTPLAYIPPQAAQPIADAGASQAVTLSGATVSVSLDGSASSPNGGGPLVDYVWTGGFDGSIAFGPNPTVTFSSVGTYEIVLMVGSEERYSEPISVTITVTPSAGPLFVRGDCNADGLYNIADGVFGLGFLFGTPTTPGCLDACDCNDDGSIDIADMVCILSGLFGNPTTPPVAPHPDCGLDPTGDALDCAAYLSCP